MILCKSHHVTLLLGTFHYLPISESKLTSSPWFIRLDTICSPLFPWPRSHHLPLPPLPPHSFFSAYTVWTLSLLFLNILGLSVCYSFYLLPKMASRLSDFKDLSSGNIINNWYIINDTLLERPSSVKWQLLTPCHSVSLPCFRFYHSSYCPLKYSIFVYLFSPIPMPPLLKCMYIHFRS